LSLLPPITAAKGLATGLLLTTAFCALGFLLLAVLYRVAPQQSGAPVAKSSWPNPLAIQAVIVAGCIWGLFNAAIGMIFGFGTAMLTERGWTLAAAGSATSLVLWIISLTSPIAGLIADKTGKHIEIMLSGFALFGIGLLMATRTGAVIPVFAALGLVAGLSVGPIMSLPARVLIPQVRAVGMGIYFSLFYAFVVLAPIIAGNLSSRAGTAAIAFDLGAFMLAACFPAYWAFSRFAARASRATGLALEVGRQT
jgi:hypothetical protein